MRQRIDVDTFQEGTEPPFEYWESDHTALVHVLWSAKNQGLTLKSDYDEIAHMILNSRWMAARENRVRTESRMSNDNH